MRPEGASIADIPIFTGGEGEIAATILVAALRADAFASSKIAPGDFVELAILAERVRFELTVPVKERRFSRPVHSTALPPLLSPSIV